MNDYEVVVGNIGTVYSGDDPTRAMDTYETYVALSKMEAGRAADMPVTLFAQGEPFLEYGGRPTQEEA